MTEQGCFVFVPQETLKSSQGMSEAAMPQALLLPYSAACPGHKAGPGTGTSSPAHGQPLGSLHSSWLESDLQECFHLRQRVLLPLSPSHILSRGCGCCRPARDSVGLRQRDAEGVMFQCPEDSPGTAPAILTLYFG